MIGKLYAVPFTSILIAAVDTKDAQSMVKTPPQFIKDLYREDIVYSKGVYKLVKPHLGITNIKMTPAFMGVYKS